MNPRTSASNPYTGRWSPQGVCHIIRADEAHLPHVEAVWYDGGISLSGLTAVHPGESELQAAERAYGARVQERYRDTFTVRTLTLLEEYPG